MNFIAVAAIPRVAESRNDIAVLIEQQIDCGCKNLDFRILSANRIDAVLGSDRRQHKDFPRLILLILPTVRRSCISCPSYCVYRARIKY